MTSSSVPPRARIPRRLNGVREATNSLSYSQVPKHRCGHLACGTYCSLASNPFTDPGPVLRRSRTPTVSRQHIVGNNVAKTNKLRDLQGRELQVWEFQHEKQNPSSNTLHPCGGRCGTEKGGFVPEISLKLLEESSKVGEINVGIKEIPLLTTEELKQKLKENPKFLMMQMCLALKKFDKYSRGIVAASTFSRLLRCFGAVSPLPEISEVLQYCIITKDGFIVYKPLIIAMFPETVPGYNDQVKNHMSPPEVWTKDIYFPACPKHQHPFRSVVTDDSTNICTSPDIDGVGTTGPIAHAINHYEDNKKRTDWENEKTPPWKFEVVRDPLANTEMTPAKSDAIRRLFAMWDRCLINDEKLKYHIKLLGVPITRETEWLLSLHSAARTLPFGKFLQALQIDDLSNFRKNRAVTPYLASCLEEPPPSRFSARKLFESRDDPLTWRCRPELSVQSKQPSAGLASMRWTSDRHRTPNNEGQQIISCDTDINEETLRFRKLRQLLVDTEAGKILPTVFRMSLDQFGVQITPELDRLLQQQETDGSVPFTRLMVAVCRAPGWRLNNSCTPCKLEYHTEQAKKHIRFAQ